MRSDDKFIKKAQQLCKMFRSEISGTTLQEMSDKFGVNLKSLSAWENGRSNKAEYLFYYYDLLDGFAKDYFLDAVFKSDGKKVILDTSKDSDGHIISYKVTIE